MNREDVESLVARARNGDRSALERVVRAVQPQVYGLAIRFLWHPEDAEDATQEILVRIVTGLGGFRGDSAFATWVFRIACNTLSTLRRTRMETHALSLDEFGEDLASGFSDAPLALTPPVDERLLWEEVKVGCTTAMLLGLDRPHRLAYILGEILELDHVTASQALDVAPATYRKRLERARASIIGLMKQRCGLVDPGNPCRCRRRVATAMARGHVDPNRLLFARAGEQVERFPEVLAHIRALDELQRAAALQRSHRMPEPSGNFAEWLRNQLERTE